MLVLLLMLLVVMKGEVTGGSSDGEATFEVGVALTGRTEERGGGDELEEEEEQEGSAIRLEAGVEDVGMMPADEDDAAAAAAAAAAAVARLRLATKF